MRRILVTGGAGFIGSNLCEAILSMGYQVRCLDNLSTGKQENIDLFSYELFSGDRPIHYQILSSLKLYRKQNICFVYHLAKYVNSRFHLYPYKD